MHHSMAKGLGAIFTVLSVVAFGCVTPAQGTGGGETVGESGDAVKWNGCPQDVLVTTLNYAPPHAFAGHCHGPASRQQAEWDGAIPELTSQCGTYCGQSYPACGAYARLDQFECIDRDIGHRWGAMCICGADAGDHGGWGASPGGYGSPGYGSRGYGPGSLGYGPTGDPTELWGSGYPSYPGYGNGPWP